MNEPKKSTLLRDMLVGVLIIGGIASLPFIEKHRAESAWKDLRAVADKSGKASVTEILERGYPHSGAMAGIIVEKYKSQDSKDKALARAMVENWHSVLDEGSVKAVYNEEPAHKLLPLLDIVKAPGAYNDAQLLGSDPGLIEWLDLLYVVWTPKALTTAMQACEIHEQEMAQMKAKGRSSVALGTLRLKIENFHRLFGFHMRNDPEHKKKAPAKGQFAPATLSDFKAWLNRTGQLKK